MTPFVAEFSGTALMMLLGNGVVANAILGRTKGHHGGAILITVGWALAVFAAVSTVGSFSGAHLNPAITMALALCGKFKWSLVPVYVCAQMLGACFGAILVWLVYRPHFACTSDQETKRAVFCTSPAIRSTWDNLLAEIIATFVLVFVVLFLAAASIGLGALDAVPVSLLVLAIGASLGGPTGYAINPARDLAPRLMHALLPMPGGKGHSDWGYAWIPVVGPLIGAALAALLYSLLRGPVAALPVH
jgi:glycerol uptake facilitator protein